MASHYIYIYIYIYIVHNNILAPKIKKLYEHVVQNWTIIEIQFRI